MTEYEAVKGPCASRRNLLTLADAYIIDSDTLARTKPSCIVMHPLPRNAEIQSEVDYHPRAAYFRQCVSSLWRARLTVQDALRPVRSDGIARPHARRMTPNL